MPTGVTKLDIVERKNDGKTGTLQADVIFSSSLSSMLEINVVAEFSVQS